jgi:hypothetical protein
MRAGRWAAASAMVFAVMGAFAPVTAQERQIRVHLGNGMELSIDRPTPAQSADDIYAALREAFAAEDNRRIAIQTGERHAGDEIILVAAPYRGVARLENDVFKSGALGGRVLVFPRGTIVYEERAANPVFALNQRPTSRGLRIVCGARPTSEALGACLMQRSSGWEVADIRSPTPFVLKELGPFVPVDAPVLTPDPEAELPPRVSGYRFVSWGSNAARVNRFARAGEVDVDMGEVRVPLRDGVATTQVGTLSVHLRRGEDGEAVIVEQSPAELDASMERHMRYAAENLSLAARMDQ